MVFLPFWAYLDVLRHRRKPDAAMYSLGDVSVCTYVCTYVRMSHSVSPKVPIVGSSNLAWMFTTINQPWGRGGFPWRWV